MSEQEVTDIIDAEFFTVLPEKRNWWYTFCCVLDRAFQRRAMLLHEQIKQKREAVEVNAQLSLTKMHMANCELDMHVARKWVKGPETFNEYNPQNPRVVVATFVVMIGECAHCKTPLSKRLYTVPQR